MKVSNFYRFFMILFIVIKSSSAYSQGLPIIGYGDGLNYRIDTYPVIGSSGLDIHWYGGIRFGDRTSNNVMQIVNGKIGIGTSSPTVALDVNASDVAAFFRSESNSVPVSVINLGTAVSTIGFKGNTSSNEYNVRVGVDGNDFVAYTNNLQRFRINTAGNVGIGTNNPKNELDVNGTIHSKEVKVDMNGWSDFVFKKDYVLPTLAEVEKHIAEKGHLENIPSEEEVLKNGINLGEMNTKLLQKIEELTLYMIQQNKKIENQMNEIETVKNENIDLKKRIEKIEKK